MKPRLHALQERKALEEIVLSKSTFDASMQMPLMQRVAWLRYELPSSMSLRQILPMVAPFILLQPFCFLSLFPGESIFEVLTHPDFLLMLLSGSLVCCLVPMIAVCAATLIFLLNPKEFLNLWVFPDLIRIRDDLLELRWTKTTEVTERRNVLMGLLMRKKPLRRIRIPWHWIASVRLRDYLYLGVMPQKVLEIELAEIPTDYSEWTLLSKASRDGTYFFDPTTKKMARKFALGGIRLPLPLFGFSSDVNVLLEHIKRKCGAAVLSDELLAADNSSQIESYTCLWLEELNSKSAPDLQRQLPIGSKLQDGAYTIASVLGSGGLSVVYLANEARTDDAGSPDSEVAIKEILCNFGGTKRSVEINLKQILSEVSMLRKLDHQNIVRYKTSFAEGSRLYIVMDLVKGCNLRQYAQSNPPLNEQELLDYARQCCSILDYLHCQSPPILHRDFTPDNLMVSGGVLKLVDFNISQATITNSSRTVMGKHCFMAPEQFCGESSAASDLYQLGTTLFFIATGTDPEPLTPCDLHALRPDLTSELHCLVRKLTDRDPGKRFASAKEVIEVIECLSKPGAQIMPKAV